MGHTITLVLIERSFYTALDRRDWPLVASGTALIGASYGLARYAYGLYLPTLRGEFGLQASTAGLVASLSYGSYLLALVAGAALCERGRARLAAVLAGAAAALGTAAVALAGSATVLGIGVAIGGASTGLSSPAMVALIAARVRPRHRDRAQTVVNAGTGVGILVSAPSALAATAHWRAAFALFAALSLAVTVAIGATSATAADARPAMPLPPGGRGRSARRPPQGSLPLVVGALGLGAAASAYWTFGRDLLAAAGATDSAGPTLWMALGAASIVAAVTGDLVARYRAGPVWAALLACLAAGTTGLALAPRSLALGLASAILFGASFVALTGVLIVWAARLEPQRPATAVSGAFILLSIGGLAGAALTGAVVDRAGYSPAFLLAAGIALACTPLAYTPAARSALACAPSSSAWSSGSSEASSRAR